MEDTESDAILKRMERRERKRRKTMYGLKVGAVLFFVASVLPTLMVSGLVGLYRYIFDVRESLASGAGFGIVMATIVALILAAVFTGVLYEEYE